MSKIPEFKPNFKYTNKANAVGTLCYATPLKDQKTGDVWAYRFLINGNGNSFNVTINNPSKGAKALEDFPLSQEPKPKVRLGLVSLNMTFGEKVYTNFNTYAEMQEGVKIDGSHMMGGLRGIVGGEVVNSKANSDGSIGVLLAIYNVYEKGDKAGQRVVKRDGTPMPPKVVKLDVVDDQLKQMFQNKVAVGANVEFGYEYINKENKTFDEFGFPVGDGKRVERIEVKKIVVHSSPKPEQSLNNSNPFETPKTNNGFNDNPFGDPFGEAANAFGGIEITDDQLPF